MDFYATYEDICKRGLTAKTDAERAEVVAAKRALSAEMRLALGPREAHRQTKANSKRFYGPGGPGAPVDAGGAVGVAK